MQIKSTQGNYSVEFISSIAIPEDAIILIDANVHRLYPDVALNHKMTKVVEVSEKAKSWDEIGSILTFLQNCHANKMTTIYAVGGGTVQDIACFVASIYYRGLKWEFVPTTLLAQADSCIGAKCGINLNGFKNQIGTFHSPKAVWIDTKFLKTLDSEQKLCGFGEIVKISLLDSWLQYHHVSNLQVKYEDMVLYALSAKRTIIEDDEHERGPRKALNYGHTFGHALEAVTNIPHGIAVAWGIDVENYFARRTGVMSATMYDQIHKFLCSRFWRKAQRPDMTAFSKALRRDKKTENGAVLLTELSEPGKWTLKPWSFESLEVVFTHYLAETGHDLFHWD